MIEGCIKSWGIRDTYGESEEKDENTVSHAVTQVKVVKVKKFEKETENQNPVPPISSQNQLSQCPKVCIDHYPFCLGSPSPSLDYLSIFSVMLLDEPKGIASILEKLWCSKNHRSYSLLAFQIAFDLVENEHQIALLHQSLSLEDLLLAPNVHYFQS